MIRSTVVRKLLAIVAMILATTSLSTASVADSWLPPGPKTYTSPNGRFRVTVTPREIGSPLSYYKDKAAHPDAVRGHATAQFDERDAAGKWKPRWINPLTNEVAPVDALVGDDGLHFVTFDNWGSMGYGPNVVVIHDGSGGVVRSLAREELLPAAYVKALSRSVSSISWRGEPRISGDSLIVPIPMPGDRSREIFIPLELRLADGALIPPSGELWDEAMAAARKIAAQDAAAEQARIAYLTHPLLGPSGNWEQEWHAYLREAFFRLTPDYLEMPVASTTVLRDPEAPDYKASEGWVIDRFEEARRFPGDIAIASPASSDNLIRVLSIAAKQVSQDGLRGSTFYIAIDAAHRDLLAQTIARTGAKLVWLDPASPIPQRPERVPGSEAEHAAQAEMMKHMLAD